ncbi:hypothetical protein JTB14_038042 [Gonioctena quinquepunctata]|nr:hypothetical protein JTB14_038042 [Gonioctena quinquepunctata]
MSQIDKLKNASSRNCNYCKNNAVSSIAQCILCEGIYHTSCALRIAGSTVVGKNNLVKCCGPTKEVISESAGTMQLEDSLKEIVSAKDLVISSNCSIERRNPCFTKILNFYKKKLRNVRLMIQANLTTLQFTLNHATQPRRRLLTTEQLDMGILQAQTKNKMDEIIQLG